MAGVLALSLLLLAGCLQGPEDTVATAPETSDVPPSRPAVSIAARPVDPEAVARVRSFFAAQEAQRLSNDLLRRERTPGDLPITERLIENAFVRVALFDEHSFIGGRIVEGEFPSRLRRWQDPVQMHVTFGASVPEPVQRADRTFVSNYARRLSGLTGHPVSLVEAGGNFHVLLLSEEERRAIGPQLHQLVPGVDQVTLDLVQSLPLSVSCIVIAFSRSGTDIYSDAIAVIRAELPDLSRRACYYEELAQGMGLPNDSPVARPSLFNDSAEFAVLTALDEYLLRILYDPRLRPGMREAEARPIIRRIVNELMTGES